MNDAAVLDAFRRIVREELAAALDRHADPRLGPFLAVCHAFSRSSVWSAAELLDDARRARRADLQNIIDQITGEVGDPAKRFGCWLAKHAGIGTDGYRLQRHKRERGVWLWSVVRVSDLPRP